MITFQSALRIKTAVKYDPWKLTRISIIIFIVAFY